MVAKHMNLNEPDFRNSQNYGYIIHGKSSVNHNLY